MQDFDYYECSDARKKGIGTLIGATLFTLLFSVVLYGFHYLFRAHHLDDSTIMYVLAVCVGLAYFAFVLLSLFLIYHGGRWVFAIRDGVFLFESPFKGKGFCLQIENISSLSQISGPGSGLDSSARLFVVMNNGVQYEIGDCGNLRWHVVFAKLLEMNARIRKEYNTFSDVVRGTNCARRETE